MSAILGQDDHLVAGSLVCQQRDQQDLIHHRLIVHAVNMLPKLVEALRESVRSLEWQLKVMPDIPEKSTFRENLTALKALLAEANNPEVKT